MMGVVRALDAGTLTVERFFALVKGQDLSPITKAWDEGLKKEKE